ncbi:hypothetical protein HHC08_03085 [Neisseria meningitidis]|uniref:hypothetical protein n=1 Tax=Neisseria meningitidis TaxID=487 RepID=UPI001C584555|nr:hypothetical protein [Neisseria meningitidis]MBW3907648.1 hypothetical protein [Neisseria meningitidis]
MPSERSFCIGARDIRNAGRLFATAGQAVFLQESGRANRKCGRDFILMQPHSGGMETPKTTKTGFRRHFWQSRLKTCRIWVTR